MRTYLKQIINHFKKDKSLFLALLFVVGVLALRLYKMDGFATFLGDQGRDAIIIKRIATLEHLTAIGPITSVGQIFLGPFYYYFVAPWLLLFKFNPLGLAIGVAVTSSVLLFWIYLFTAELFSKKLAWFIIITSGVATALYSFARFSWNPNLLPYVAFLVVLSTQHLFKTKKNISAIVLGVLLSIAVQLHYIALILLPPVILIFTFYFFFEKKKVKEILNLAFITGISFTVVSSPLIMFDLRHGFLNLKNFLKLFTQTGTVNGGKWEEFLSVFQALNKFIFNVDLNKTLPVVLLIVLFSLLLWALKKNRQYSLISLFFIFILTGLSLYGGPKYSHYMGSVYIYYLAVIGIMILSLPKKITPVIMGIFLILFSYISVQHYDFLRGDPNYQIRHAKRITESMFLNIHVKKFQITSLPERYSDYSYRYFLEVAGKKPLEKDTLEKADELFVLCEGRCDLIIGNPTWDIAFFAPRKITKQWVVENVTIYKLTR
ncbi:hypothetical protein A2690_04205 [Candidatus Roizmanbacteria bacterium RIFCSPHIGHO2_01_FULL_39_12b]|uniref:Glycosyltransferase RgtA/B/C/D-like domain-containing protein n=1 Tax=Candidatus Roizmanbacteria bacterium RIFCSPHIGHO2_01_FULL_39_12b TaxID=1802030 RepID=A0A1F7GCL6_9BACT|nr:MAG: hypothetical protein A2690_04205 [Candidatus Roizmanbacteria bacterium RIFCSPHIGHO2_01_FULL_39_12b]OGK47145.1 MAG: hypothetical protein A3B46_01930 [Candidatus Roizmanbacteria bacterium RIFCSPLOWO2_01_FULL_39_19]